MRVIVNALSATNLSARAVLLGHLSRLAEWTLTDHEYVVLHHAANRDIRRDMGPNVCFIEAPEKTAHWFGRSVWERMNLPKLLAEQKPDILLMPSGTVVGNCTVPQVSYAMNPWCLVRRTQRTAGERIKGFLQRYAYRQAVRKAAMMAYLSEYMRLAYRANAECEENLSEVVYAGLEDDLLKAAAEAENLSHHPNRIVSVSVMAPHKGVETMVQAVSLLRKTHGIPAELELVGGWPDENYRRLIQDIIDELNLVDCITFSGHVSRSELFKRYSEARVFCLMSWCESFGIPAVEAQAFGTPVVSSNCCAIPEVCGKGGTYPAPGDAAATADALAKLLAEEETWRSFSKAAIQNATRFRYDICTKPLMRMFEVAGKSR
jgi:glycosyltransferase involved in cell wall biosynthesis